MQKFIPYGFIYITECLVNSKKYIGQRRYCKRGWESYLGSGRLLLKAISKYKRKNFKRTILYEAFSQEELNRIEILLIAEFDAVNSTEYYNLVDGGRGKTNGFENRKHSIETRKRMSNSAKNHLVTEETKQKIRETRKQKYSENIKNSDYKNKIDLAHKKQAIAISGKNNIRAKSILIDGILYETLTAARKSGYSYSFIRKTLNISDHLLNN